MTYDEAVQKIAQATPGYGACMSPITNCMVLSDEAIRFSDLIPLLTALGLIECPPTPALVTGPALTLTQIANALYGCHVRLTEAQGTSITMSAAVDLARHLKNQNLVVVRIS